MHLIVAASTEQERTAAVSAMQELIDSGRTVRRAAVALSPRLGREPSTLEGWWYLATSQSAQALTLEQFASERRAETRRRRDQRGRLLAAEQTSTVDLVAKYPILAAVTSGDVRVTERAWVAMFTERPDAEIDLVRDLIKAEMAGLGSRLGQKRMPTEQEFSSDPGQLASVARALGLRE